MGVLEHVDQRGVAGQGGLELLGRALRLGPRGAERGALARQLLFELVLAPVSAVRSARQASCWLGPGWARVRVASRTTTDCHAAAARATSGRGSAQEPAEVAEPPLPLQDGPLPGQDLPIARPGGDPRPRRGREEGIETVTEHIGHDHLLAFGLGVGGQVEVVPADVHRLLVEGFGGGVVPLRLQQRRQAAQAGGGEGVALAQHRLADRQGLLVEGLGGGVVPLLIEQPRQVVQAGGGVGVALAQRRLADGQGLLVEGLGGGVVPLRLEQHRQVVEVGGGVGVFFTQGLFIDRQRLLEEGLGGGVVPLRPKQLRQVVQAGGGVGVALAQHRLADGQGLTRRRNGFGVLAGSDQVQDRSVEPFRLGQTGAPVPVHSRQALDVCERLAGIDDPPIGRATPLPQDLQRLAPGRSRRREVLALDMELGQPAQARGDHRMITSREPALDGQHRLGGGDRLGGLARDAEFPGLLREALVFLQGRRLRVRRRGLAVSRRGAPRVWLVSTSTTAPRNPR